MRVMKAAVRSQRLTLGIGLAALLVISAASIAMDVKSRADAVWVDHTLDVVNKLTDLHLLVRKAESTARGFAVTNDENLAREFRETNAQIPAAVAELKAEVSDNPAQSELLESTEPILKRRLAVTAELLRLREEHDYAGVAERISRAEGRAAMEKLTANLDRLTAEERRLVATRSTQSQRSGRLLVMIDQYSRAGNLFQFCRQIFCTVDSIEIEAKEPVCCCYSVLYLLFRLIVFIIQHFIAAGHPIQKSRPVSRRYYRYRVPELYQQVVQCQRRPHRIWVRFLVHGNNHLFRNS